MEKGLNVQNLRIWIMSSSTVTEYPGFSPSGVRKSERQISVHWRLNFLYTVYRTNVKNEDSVFNYFVPLPKNTQLFHKLSHSSHMFRHYRAILREFVVSTLPSYISMSKTVVGNTIETLQIISHKFHAVEIAVFKIFEILKLSYLQ